MYINQIIHKKYDLLKGELSSDINVILNLIKDNQNLLDNNIELRNYYNSNNLVETIRITITYLKDRGITFHYGLEQEFIGMFYNNMQIAKTLDEAIVKFKYYLDKSDKIKNIMIE